VIVRINFKLPDSREEPDLKRAPYPPTLDSRIGAMQNGRRMTLVM
jgi:hypothetical protein